MTLNDKTVSGQESLTQLLDQQEQLQFATDVSVVETLLAQRFIQTYSLASRRYSKSSLSAHYDVQHFHHHWRILDAVRVLLLRHADRLYADKFPELLQRLLKSTDSDERIAIGYALPFLADPKQYHDIAAESLRTNQNTIFVSIAHNNSYTEYLDDNTFNQMVLKAIFISEALAPIVALDSRANPALAHMLMDYVRERLAASRQVTSELYRAVGKHLTTADLATLKRHFAASEHYSSAQRQDMRDALINCLTINSHVSGALELRSQLQHAITARGFSSNI